MRAVVCRELGPLDHLELVTQPDLAAGPGQVVVEVRAAGVNFVDGLICQGRYQIKPPTPFVPGSELAGVVTSVGADVTRPAPGDRVLAFTGFGAFASQALVGASAALPVPANLDFARAAALVQSYSTALFTMTRRTSVSPGETVLVLGAGGGVGLAAVDVATALGATVIGAASTKEKLAAAEAMGATALIDYESEDLKARARELTEGGVDVVIDPVGGGQSEPALRALRSGGRYCVIGFASGEIASLPLNQVLLNNRTVVGVDWGAWTFRDPAGNRALLDEVLSMVGEGRLHPAEPSVRPLDDASLVMQQLLSRDVAGKVVLVP